MKALALVIGILLASQPVDLAFEETRVDVVVGQKFTLHSQLTNPGPAQTGLLLAHLNVASLNSDVYVDPEDWSANRSQTVEPIAQGARTSLTWELQAVNAGSFDVYVVLLPNDVATAGMGPLIVSRPVHVTVTARPTLNAGGSLPVVFAVPAILGLIVVVLYRSRRGRA